MIHQKVFVYWNLHKKCWSLKLCKTRRVFRHLAELTLVNCKFKVSEAGRQRVIREKRKNVHAGVEGFLFTGKAPTELTDSNRVRYNPYTQAKFTVGGEPVDEAPIVVFKSDRSVYAVSSATFTGPNRTLDLSGVWEAKT